MNSYQRIKGSVIANNRTSMAHMSDFLLLTDLDGTLMEHDTYSIEPAREILHELNERKLNPIFNSSKTRVEIEHIQSTLNIENPFVCENGAAYFEKDSNNETHCATKFGPPRSSWLADIHLIRHQQNLKFEGFSDWTAEQIATETGLSVEESAFAKQREFSEPIRWRDSMEALQQFKRAIYPRGLQLVEGGRFLSIQGKFTKRSPIDWLRFERGHQEATIIALGDSPNDIPMLECAHVAGIINSSKSQQLVPAKPLYTFRSQLSGPSGWAETMKKILQLIDSGELQKTMKGNRDG